MSIRNNRSSFSGFTLIELLAVIVIISLLLSLSMTAIQSLTRSIGVTQGVSNLAALLERARVYAMANSTYVYLGFDDTTSPGDLDVSTMFSPTGENNNVSNLIFLSNRVHLSKISLSAAGVVAAKVSGAATGNSVFDAKQSDIPQIKMQSGGKDITYSYIIKFSPDGTATAQASGVSRWIQLGVTPPSAGPSPTNVALIQITGLTGSVQVLRP